MNREFTRSGTRRGGDDYQDVVALETLVEWLEHPSRYVRVTVEDDEAGFLDDVVSQTQDGVVCARQVKFSAHPERDTDAWEVADLIERRRNRAGDQELPSLWEKWTSSWRTLKDVHGQVDAVVTTNRRAGASLAAALDQEGRLELGRIADASIAAAFVEQTGEDAAEVIAAIRFEMDRRSLEDLEVALRRRFHLLGGTEAGWLNLKDELRQWVRYRGEPRPSGEIALDDVRRAALWLGLRALPQDFEIPDDYVVPSRSFHEGVLNRIRSSSGETIVLTGSPGTGKSTYVSFLYRALIRESIPVVRHHYFLSLRRYDASRLGHEAAAESLMHDVLRDFPEALEGVEAQNPNPQHLRAWIQQCGGHFSRENLPFVVIVDGLDHVWRERRSVEELERLLDGLLPVPSGVVLFFATQPVDDTLLPASLSRAAPANEWLALPELGPEAVEEWLRHQAIAFPEGGLDQVPATVVSDLSSALHNKTAGHPLHLRYVVETVQQRDLELRPDVIASLPGGPSADIRAYYADLWRHLSDPARLVLHLLAVCRFPLPSAAIHDSLSIVGVGRGQSQEALRWVRHLLQRDSLGLRPFHSSLLTFVEGLPENADHREKLRGAALRWLRESAPEHWRWSYLWLLEAEGGNAESLKAGPSLEWAMQAIVDLRDPQAASRMMAESSWRCLNDRNLSRAMEVSAVHDYFLRPFEYERDVVGDLMRAACLVEGDAPDLRARLRTRVDRFTTHELATLAESEARAGNWEGVDQLRDEILQRLRDNAGELHRSSGPDAWVDDVLPLASAEALRETPDIDYLLSVAHRNRDFGLTAPLLRLFGRQLRIHGRSGPLRALLGAVARRTSTEPEATAAQADHDDTTFSDEECSGLRGEAALYGLEEGIDFDHELIGHESLEAPLVALYSWRRGRRLPALSGTNTSLAVPVDAIAGSAFGDECEDLIGNTFMTLLAHHIHGAQEADVERLAAPPTTSEGRRMLSHLNRVAGRLAAQLTEGSAAVESLFSDLAVQPPPSWPATREEAPRRLASRARRAGHRLSLELAALCGRGTRNRLGAADLEALFGSGYCDPLEWIRECGRTRFDAIDRGGLEFLERWYEGERARVRPFREKAELAAALATVMAQHGDRDAATRLRLGAARNLMAHGDHKDMLLFQALETIEMMDEHQAADPDVIMGWLAPLASVIAVVEDFTDSDETGALPRELARTLGQVDPRRLTRYYAWLVRNQEHYDALHAFRVLMKVLDLADPVARAVAATAVDPGARAVLAGRAEEGDSEARQIIEELTAMLGDAANAGIHSEPEDDWVEPRHEAPIAADFPPERLRDFLGELRARGIYRMDSPVDDWIAYWAGQGAGVRVLEFLKGVVSSDRYSRIGDQVFELSRRLEGDDAAFEWLVRAQRDDQSWSRYFTAEEAARARWRVVQTVYGDRWFEFLRDSVVSDAHASGPGYFSWVRVVRYLLLMGQRELALDAATAAVAVSLALVPLDLDPPQWLGEGA